MATRVLVTVRDSVGCGHVPDAADVRLVSELVEAAPR
jgi:phosphopentomutase